jgi:hypothetical protein
MGGPTHTSAPGLSTRADPDPTAWCRFSYFWTETISVVLSGLNEVTFDDFAMSSIKLRLWPRMKNQAAERIQDA